MKIENLSSSAHTEAKPEDTVNGLLERIGSKEKLIRARSKIEARVPGLTEEELDDLMKDIHSRAMSIIMNNGGALNKDDEQYKMNENGKGLGVVPGGDGLAHFGQVHGNTFTDPSFNSRRKDAQREGFIWGIYYCC